MAWAKLSTCSCSECIAKTEGANDRFLQRLSHIPFSRIYKNAHIQWLFPRRFNHLDASPSWTMLLRSL